LLIADADASRKCHCPRDRVLDALDTLIISIRPAKYQSRCNDGVYAR